MRIYRIEWRDPHEGLCYRWAPTQYEAAKERTAARAMYAELPKAERPEVTIDPLDIEPTREGLARWLNQHFKTDNG